MYERAIPLSELIGVRASGVVQDSGCVSSDRRDM
jgi:hypothetical protein